jgi:hypothetical protein
VQGKENVAKAFAEHGKGLSKKLWQADMGSGFEVERSDGDINSDAEAITHIVRRGKEQFGHKKPNVPVHWNVAWRFICRGKKIISYTLTKTPIANGAE